MPRGKRRWISEKCGSFHIISHTTENTPLFTDEEKEKFFNLMKQLAKGFFINIHSYCIMGNHFHILATGTELKAKRASEKELIRRYKAIYGKNAEPPEGSYDDNFSKIMADEDNGIERLRERLGSISRYVQELKQGFSRWYNKKHNRKGCLWRERFKGVLVYHGLGELICSAYIDLNPIRAGVTDLPEEYNWSSLGIRLKSPVMSRKFLYPINYVDALETSVENKFSDDRHYTSLPFMTVSQEMRGIEWYRQFVYASGGIEIKGKAHLPQNIVEEVLQCNGYLGIRGRLCYRIRNISGGIALGGYATIEALQKKLNRRYVRSRSFIDSNWIFATRVLRR